MHYDVIIRQGEIETTLAVKNGQRLWSALSESNHAIISPCAGKGMCGKCKVQVLAKQVPISIEDNTLLSDEEINRGVRLACTLIVESDLVVEIPREEKTEVWTDGLVCDIPLDPPLVTTKIALDPPSLQDQRDFLQRIRDKAPDLRIDGDVLQDCAVSAMDETLVLRTYKEQVLCIEPAREMNNSYGIAVDIGTTTLALYLLDLTTGQELDVFSVANPQKKYGSDVVSRIAYSEEHPDGVRVLTDVLVEGLNYGIRHLIKRNSLKERDILLLAVAGNTVMLHFLVGVSAGTIARSPFTPIFTEALEFRPAKIGINMHPQGIVQLLPSVTGYIGADIVGDLLAVYYGHKLVGCDLIVDIGTNGEIVLVHDRQLTACSTAAGPAFEGANISWGVPGVPGAITSYKLDCDGMSRYKTISGAPPRGICGSGLVDIIAELLEHNILDSTGAFVPKEELPVQLRKKVTRYHDMVAFEVVSAQESESREPIVITQKDIREVQLAKGAIAAGISTLLDEVGGEDRVDNIFLAGGFGNYMDVQSASIIGLIPPQLASKVQRIGNGAGVGAKIFALNRTAHSLGDELRKGMRYVELSNNPRFQQLFMDAMLFSK